jgi:DNA-binding SARP family transcriptional activator
MDQSAGPGKASEAMKGILICFLTLVWMSPAQAEVGDAMDYFNLGLKSTATNRKIEYFTKALELKPDLAAAYEKRGLLYFFKEEYDKVIRDFGVYINLAPAKAEAYRMLAMGYLKSEAYHLAIRNFTRAIEMDPGLASAYAYRAESYRSVGDYEGAISDASKALDLGGDSRTRAIAFITRAKVYRGLGDIDQAFIDSKAALKADPSIWGISYSNPQVSRRAAPVVLIGLSFVVFLGLKQRHHFRSSGSQPIKTLKSKLLPPDVSDTLKRERLLFLLSNIRKRRLTTVVGGPGYGKSALIAQIGGFLRLDQVWYRLDESDKDFITFISYLIATVRQRFPGFAPATLQMMEEAGHSDRDRETILRVFLSEIEDTVTEELVIVLDDYHAIRDSAEIKDTMEFLLRNLSPAVHLVLISRTEIDLPLSRLKAMREVIEITESDLAFTTHEIAELFSKVFDISLGRGNLEVIYQKTGGWVSGLILFHHSLKEKTSDNMGNMVSNLHTPPEIVLSYLEENVYRRLSEDTKDFLIKTSILDHITAPFCDQLLSIDYSADILKYLENRHLFISAVGDQRGCYGYHPLFQEFLRIELKKELDAQEIVKLHQDAAALQEEAGEKEGVVGHDPLGEFIEKACNSSHLNMVPSHQAGELPKHAPAELKVHLLGRFKLLVGDEEVSANRWKSKKAKTLFQYLLYTRSRGYANKEVLMELLWPEEDPRKTAKRLHVALASLRKTLEPDILRGTPSSYISRDHDSYRIDVGEKGWVDIENFTEETSFSQQENNPEEAIVHYLNAESIYRGDFLEEDLYTEWCIDPRERFKEQYLQLLREIVEYFESKGDYKKCIEYAKKYLDKDKYDEDVYQLLMTYYAHTGNKAMMAKTFERCKKAIAADLNCPISEETERLYKELMST